jgi:N-acetylneuraminate synthase
MNLRTIADLADRFGVPVGLSDHTMELAVPLAAVTLGASIIEKHLTLSRSVPGPDSAFSLEPSEFGEMVAAVRQVEAALGTISYKVTAHEESSRVFRRSLFVVEDIDAGEALTHKNVRAIRPGHGLPPKYLDEVIGAHASKRISAGTPLSWDLVER